MRRSILIFMVEPAPPLLIEEMRNIFNHKSQRNKQLGHSFSPAIRSYFNIYSELSSLCTLNILQSNGSQCICSIPSVNIPPPAPCDICFSLQCRHTSTTSTTTTCSNTSSVIRNNVTNNQHWVITNTIIII